MTNHDSGVEATTTTASVVPDNNNNNNNNSSSNQTNDSMTCHKTIVESATTTTTNPDIIVTGDHTTTTTTTSTTNHSNNISNHHNNSSNTTSSDNITKTDAKPSTATATTAKKRKRTHYSNELDDIRVPEKIETKKRKLLGAMTAATTTIPIAALGAAEQIVQSPASSCSLLIDPFDIDHHSQQQTTMIDASGSQHRRSYCTDVSLLPPSAIIAVTSPLSTTFSTTPSTTTAAAAAATSTTTPPTPITAPAYHYKSKNVDTTHVIVRSNKALNSQQQQQQQASDSSQPHQSTNESSQQQQQQQSQQQQQQQKLGGSNYTANSSSSNSSSSSGFDKKSSSIADEHMEHTDALLEDDDDEDENGDDHLWYSGAMNPHISIEDTAATGTDGHSTLVHSQSSDALDATGGASANTSGKSNMSGSSGRFINPMELIPPSPNVGKVGIQLVKQINTQYVFEKYKDANIRNPIMSPGSIELHWDRRPERVLVMKQIHTDRTDKQFERVVDYLVNEKKVSVYVEPVVYEKLKWPCLQTFPDYLNSAQGRNLSNGGATQQQNGSSSASSSSSASTTTGAESSSNDTNNPSSAVLTHQQPGYRNLHKLIDLIICLGGDGTILHTASMFPSAVPPILGFNMGSLGFLTAFNVKRYKEYITHVFNGSVYLSTRMRLTCKIRRKDGTIENHRYQVLNEIVVDRGPSPYLCNLDCYCNNVHITTVQADGLILATPTGSTAYSMSAGGSIVHPNVNCLLLTPICPHSLSFRPIILPDSTILTIKVPQDSRATAWISFDGKSRQELQRGDAIIVTTSIWPVPLICKTEETSEWFMNLTNIFNWNQRERQRSFTSSQDEDESSGSEAE